MDRAASNDPTFTILDLEAQAYPSDFLSTLADVMKKNTHLVYLNLAKRQAGNSEVRALCLGLRSNTTLKKLSLANTGIALGAAQALCDLLIVNRSLTHLNLAGNPLIADSCARFAEVIKSNKTLVHLDVSECNFTAAPWREALRWNCTLQELEASISIPNQGELTYGLGSAGRALTSSLSSSSSGVGASTSKQKSALSLSQSSLIGTNSSSGPDRFIQPLTNEPNSECQLMIKTNRILGTLNSFMDENRGLDAFVQHLRRVHPTILIDACRRGHQAAVHRLLELGVDPNEAVGTLSPKGPTSPRKNREDSSSHSHTTHIQPPPSSQTHTTVPPNQSTQTQHETHPLQEAILHGNVHIIKLLISYGATVTDETVASLPNSGMSSKLPSSANSTPLSRSATVSAASTSSNHSLSREILKILRDGQNGVIDLSDGTYSLFGPTSIVARPGIFGLKLNNNSLGPNFPPFLMASLLQIGSQLTVLKLKGNGLQSIPSQIGDLPNLQALTLSDNNLETLPASLGQLSNLRILKVRKNPLTLLPEEVHKKGTARILQYLKEITVPVHAWSRMKLLVVGKENVGKTHLIRRLQKRDYSHNMSTDGLEISDVPVTKKVDFCIFDFGGQQVFYPTHMFFLSDRALFTVVFSALDDESFRTVEYWLKVIRALSAGTSNTPVLLVATHMDDPQAQNAIPDLKERLKKLRQSYRSILRDVMFVSNKTGEGHKELKAKLVELALAHKILTTPVPESYVLMEKLISKEKSHQRPLIMWSEYRAIAKNAHIYDDSTLRACSQFMHDVGNIIWFNQPELSELVILDPQWLSDVMASVISFKANWKSGLLQHDSLPIVWKQYPVSLHKTLLGILERFEVVFPIKGGEGASIVPAMLPDSCPEAMEAFNSLRLPRAEYQRVERTYRFGFMPIGFFPRLAARLFLIPNLFCHDPWLRGVMISPPSAFETAEEQFDAQPAQFSSSHADNFPPGPLSNLLVNFLTRTAAYRKGSIHVGEIERYGIIQQYATLTALMRGFEQASVSYYESAYASILNITVWRPIGPDRPPPDNLMTYIVDTVEELLATNYKKYDDSIERIVVHTSATNASVTSEFTLPDIIQRISAGEKVLKCRDEMVDVEDLAPDLCFTDVHRFNDVVIEQELGEGGVGLVFLATVPTADLMEAEHLDSLSLVTPTSSTDGIHVSRSSSQGGSSSFPSLLHSASDPSLAVARAEPDQPGGQLSSSGSSLPTYPLSNSPTIQPLQLPKLVETLLMEPIREEPEAESLSGTSSSARLTSPLAASQPSLSSPKTSVEDSPATASTPVPAETTSEETAPVHPVVPLMSPKKSKSAGISPRRKKVKSGRTKEEKKALTAEKRRAEGALSDSNPESSQDSHSPRSPHSPHSASNSARSGGAETGAVVDAGSEDHPTACTTSQEICVGLEASDVAVAQEESSSGNALKLPVISTTSSMGGVPMLRRSKDKKGRRRLDFNASQEDLPPLDSSEDSFSAALRIRRSSIDSQPQSTTPRSRSPGVATPLDGSELSKSFGSDSASPVGSPLVKRSIQSDSNSKNGRTLIALKRFKVQTGMEVQRFREFAHEVRLMASLNHPCVVRLHGVQLSPLGMVMEYIAGKDLCTILHNPAISDEAFNWRIRAKLALDIARGMRYLQTQTPPIVHRDLRSPNIFVLGLDESLAVSAKVADFGLSMRVLSNFNDVLQTWQWLAPEVIDMTHCNYDETSDVYSYGIVLWEIATRKFPFSEYTAYIHQDKFELTEAQLADPQMVASLQTDGWELKGNVAVRETYNRQKFVDLILKENLRPTIPSKVPPAFARLIEMCWAREPAKRPSFHTIASALSKMLGDKSRRWTTVARAGSSIAAPGSHRLPLSGSQVSLNSPKRNGFLNTSSLELPATSEEDVSGSSGSPGSDSTLATATGSASSAANATPPNRNLKYKKTSPNLMSTLTFLQQLQDGDGAGGLENDSVFQNLVSTSGVAEGADPDRIDELSPRIDESPRVMSGRGSRGHLFVHSTNLNVTASMPTSGKAPVILTRTLEEELSGPAMVMAQAEENRIWVGQQDGRISVFDSTSPPKFVTSFSAHKKDLFAMAVVGQEMWVGSADANISVWSIKKLKQKKILKEHARIVRCILSIPKLGKNNPTGFVISGDTDGTLIVWKNMVLANKILVAPNQPINSLIYVEESKHLWVGTYRKIFIYSVQDWSLVTEIQAHDGMISAMVKTGDMVWTCCSNTNSLACWDTKTLDNKMTIKGTPRITCLALVSHPIDKTVHLWAGSLEKVIYLYDCATGELVESLKGHTDYVYSMVKLYNEQSVWTAGRDRLIRTWNF
jgi:GTPase SAR1 family protein